jgi:drug/metabolite transporter (DMT)-like permease
MLKDTLQRVPVADFLAVRFAMAALALIVLRPRAAFTLPRPAVRHAVILGVVYGGAQIVQTVGLTRTAASVSGFITGLYVVLTPLLAATIARVRLSGRVWTAVGVATLGLAVLGLRGGGLGGGELLTLASAGLYAAHIVGLGQWSAPGEAYALTVLQMVVIAAVTGAAALPGGVRLPATGGDWAVLVYMALVAGAGALIAQTWAQARMPAARAAIIMTTEPVFAAVFAVAFGGEQVTARLLIGGALVVAGMLIVDLPSPRWPWRRRTLAPTRGP